MRNHRAAYIIVFLILILISKVGFSQVKVEIDTTFSKDVVAKPTEHLLGVRYSYDITGVHFTPDIHANKVHTSKNIALLYTYYHNLWDSWNFFGIQFGAKLCQYGFTSEYNIKRMDQTFTAIEVPLVSQFKLDLGKHFRVMLDIGGFGGYRIKTTKRRFSKDINRWDYGALGGGGFALRFHPIEIHIEALYQYSLAWLYAPDTLSDEWWMYSYPNRLSFNIGLHINFD